MGLPYYIVVIAVTTSLFAAFAVEILVLFKKTQRLYFFSAVLFLFSAVLLTAEMILFRKENLILILGCLLVSYMRFHIAAEVTAE